MKKYQKLKQKIIEANPELKVPMVNMTIDQLEEIAGDVGYFETKQYIKERPIRLADVLLAISLTWDNDEQIKEQYIKKGKMYELLDLWNLKDDSLDNQSQETKQFLIDILTKGN